MKTFPLLNNEFPGFDMDDLTIPDSWADVSWHNDICPSFKCGNYTIWIDHKLPDQRELDHTLRFSIAEYNSEMCWVADICESDDFDIIKEQVFLLTLRDDGILVEVKANDLARVLEFVESICDDVMKQEHRLTDPLISLAKVLSK